MSWTNQGGFPTGTGSATNIVTTTINNFDGAEIVTYATRAALLAAVPIADTIGVVADDSGDGFEGRAYLYNVADPGWVSAESPVTVNSKPGPVITLDAGDIAPTGTRLWLSPDTLTTIGDISATTTALAVRVGDAETDIAAIEVEQATQNSRLTATESATSINAANITALNADYGGRLTTAETNITALQTAQSIESGRLTALEAGQTTQDTRLTNIETVNTTQGGQITTLQGTDATQTSQIAALQAADAAAGVQVSAIDARLLIAESDILALESGQAVQDVATNAIAGRVTTAETNITALQSGQATLTTNLQGLATSLPITYQARAEKNQAGGYPGLRIDGTIDPNQLPPSVKTVRETNYVATIAERDALAANDPRPEIDGPWGVNQAGYAVVVADTGAGDAGFFVWNGAAFLDFTATLLITSSDDISEGSTNLFYLDSRVANAPAVTGLVVAVSDLEDRMDNAELDLNTLEAEQITQNNRLTATEGATAVNAGDIDAIEAEQITQNNRLTATEAATATNAGDIDGLEADVAALQASDTAQTTAINARLTSFNGRTAPAVIPTAGDYAASMLTNDSGVPGATVSDALTGHGAEIDALAALIGPVANKVTKGGDSDAAPLVIGTNDAQPLTLETNNTPRIVVGAAGEVTINGLTENAMGSHYLKQDPATKRLYATPVVDVAMVDLSMLPEVTWISGNTVQVGVGKAVCRSIVDDNSERLWRRPYSIAPITATLPVGFSGSNAYVFLATNGTGDSASDTAFISSQDPPNNTPTGFNWVRMVCPLFVESGVIKKGTHLPGLQRFNYDVDWSTNINPVATAGGGLISVGVPVYPIAMNVFCSSGSALTSGVATSTRFSRNSANTTPAITQPNSFSAGFDGDISSYYVVSGAYIFTPWAHDGLITATAQVRAMRSGAYTESLPTFRISGYSWSK